MGKSAELFMEGLAGMSQEELNDYEAWSSALDFQSLEQEAQYEMAMVEEARRIVAGTSQATPTREHLRVLLGWLDGPGELCSAPVF